MEKEARIARMTVIYAFFPYTYLVIKASIVYYQAYIVSIRKEGGPGGGGDIKKIS